MPALLTVSPEAKALLRLYENALLSATYEYLHGEELREECEASEDPSAHYTEAAEGCKDQDAALMKEFENLLAAFASALLPV